MKSCKIQHHPADLLVLLDFMLPRDLTKTAMPAPSFAPPTPKFTAPALARSQAALPAPPAESAKRLVCARCNVKISFLEGKFCWNNAQRFGGLAYCREHQALM